MNKFEEERLEYLEMINSDEYRYIIEKIISDNDVSDVRRKNASIIANPSNKKELRIAKLTVSLVKNIFELFAALTDDKIKEISYDENPGIQVIVEKINDMKANGKKEKKELENVSEEEAARIFFGFTIAFASDMDEALSYLGEKCGYDLDDPEQSNQFNDYMNILNSTSPTNKNEFKETSKYTEKEIKSAEKFAVEFNRLCEEYIIKESENTDEKVFSINKKK